MNKEQIKNNDVVIVASFARDWEAHLAQGYLANHDIRSMLTNETFNSIYPFPFSNSWSNINLWVNADQAEQAQKVLASFDPSAIDTE